MQIFIGIYLLFFSLNLYSSSLELPAVTLHDCDDGEAVYNLVRTTIREESLQDRRVILALDIDGNLLNSNSHGVILSSFGTLLNDDPQWQDSVYGIVYITARSCLNEPNIVQTTHSHLCDGVEEVYRFSQSDKNFMGYGIHREENCSTVMKFSKGVLIMGESPYNKAQAAHWLFNVYKLPEHSPGYTLIFSDDDAGWRIGFSQGQFSPPGFRKTHCIHYDLIAEAKKNALRFLRIEDGDKDDSSAEDSLLSPISHQSIPFPFLPAPSLLQLPPSLPDLACSLTGADTGDEFDEILNGGPWVQITLQTPHESVET